MWASAYRMTHCERPESRDALATTTCGSSPSDASSMAATRTLPVLGMLFFRWDGVVRQNT